MGVGLFNHFSGDIFHEELDLIGAKLDGPVNDAPGLIEVVTDADPQILAKALAAGYYETWYEEALNTAGVEISYDADGNPIED